MLIYLMLTIKYELGHCQLFVIKQEQYAVQV